MKASESYWRALCITLGVLIGYFTFHTPPCTTVIIPIGIPQQIEGVPDWQERDVKCLRDVIYNESRNQDTAGQVAVAAVVINRVLDSSWPAKICRVTRQPNQFAAWVPAPANVLERRALARAERLAIYTLNNYATLAEGVRSYKYFNSGPPKHLDVTTIGDHHFSEEYV